ncbi:MAG: glycine cleavage system aminomethyltransferase GcvT [Candidatus Margulisbacteria bacterium]|nr:glycine cleavage system aminomethyltransferase GcvT [Candidatus Margulisiibacteriota bacterium]
MKKTALNSAHKKLKAKMIVFHDWEMPISYSGIIEEHKAVRQKAGIFDVSHMGVIDITGIAALNYLQYLTVNDVGKLKPNDSQYTMMLNNDGQVLDDMILTRFENYYRLVVNCSNFQKIIEWMKKNQSAKAFQAELKHRDDLSIIALQGPESKSILMSICEFDSQIKSFTVTTGRINAVPVIVSHTGYTGEDGYEIFVDNGQAEMVWNLLLGKGAAPIGLGARDTLRIEAGLPLYGQEIYNQITPFDIGYGWIVKLSKPEFVGKKYLESVPRRRRLYGVSLKDRVVPRQGCEVKDLGMVTSGTFSPTLNKSIALFLANRDLTDKDTAWLKIREKEYQGQVMNLPFIKKKGINN